MWFPQFNEELKHIRGVFEQYDEDVNGSIDLEELKKCLQKLTLTLKEEVEDLFHSCDIDNSTSSMFLEVINLLVEHSSSPPKSIHLTSKMGSPELQATFDTIVEAFLFLDKNGNGKLLKERHDQSIQRGFSLGKIPSTHHRIQN
ncbi:hypothetical protein POPTR_017G054902v4 [Populus trichocarpa]|uniref:Leucine-rich repeat-containing N-terminal plant-type domain-containing protein n=1 Tax=Populus trichocarpa TaxID=3694 RepID=A0A3N7G6K1_POPTR|nr:hypothetical protein POPTR_017G054902v4 [Populus trichocarpa]